MEISVHESKSNIIVHIKDKFREKRMSYSINYLSHEVAKRKADSLAAKLRFFPDLNWEDVEKFLKVENKEVETEYVAKGKGITISSGKKCFSIYFQFLEGPSPNFRIQFSKYLFGEKRAYILAKRFHQDYCTLRKTAFATDSDVEKLIEKYEKIKMQQELMNLETERRERLQKYRENKT